MAGVGLPLYGHCPYTRTQLADGNMVETLRRGWATKSIVSMQGTPSSESQSLWAGDVEEESTRGGITGNKNLVLSRLPLKREAELTGAAYNEELDEMRDMAVPEPPYVRSGCIARLLENGATKYRVIVYMSVKYGPIEDSYKTAQQTPEYQTISLSGAISSNAAGIPRIKRDFSGAAAFDRALAYFYELLNIPQPLLTPAATPAPGEIEVGATVALAGDKGADIRYTTSGVDVDMSNGTLYEEPITITAATTIKARAYDPAGERSSSPQFTGAYTVTGSAAGASTFAAGIHADAVADELAGFTKAQLQAFAGQSGIVVNEKDTKAKMIEDILAQLGTKQPEAAGDGDDPAVEEA